MITRREFIRFANHLIQDGECIKLKTSTLPNGYGQFQIKRNHKWRNFSAHRFVMGFINKEDIQNKEIDHLCKNRACCSYNHLKIVPKGFNAQQGLDSQLDEKRNRTHCIAGHEFTHETLSWTGKYKNKRRCLVCHRNYMKRYAKYNMGE